MPPLPKPTDERRRRNKPATAAKLLALAPDVELEVPELPGNIEWHPMTVAWWGDVWASPMAPEYQQADRHGLFLLAVLVDSFWRAPSKDLAAEIRLQRQCFGLTPIDRRRLQWEVVRTDEARERRQASKAPRSVTDPRASGAATGRRRRTGGTAPTSA